MEQSNEQDEPRTYEVIISPTAFETMASIESKADRKRIDKVLRVLDTVPGIGRA